MTRSQSCGANCDGHLFLCTTAGQYASLPMQLETNVGGFRQACGYSSTPQLTSSCTIFQVMHVHGRIQAFTISAHWELMGPACPIFPPVLVLPQDLQKLNLKGGCVRTSKHSSSQIRPSISTPFPNVIVQHT